MKCYILARNGEPRNRNLLANCQDLGFDSKVVNGFDGQKLSNSLLLDICNESRIQCIYGRTLTGGEIACSLGHFEIYRQFAELGEKWCLVLEDDVEVLGNIQELLVNLEKMPRKPNIITMRIINRGPIVSKLCKQTIGDFERILNAPYGTSAYFINDLAVKMIINKYKDKKIDSVADWPVAALPYLRFWICNINVLREEIAPSNLENERLIKSANLTTESFQLHNSLISKFMMKLEKVKAMRQVNIEWSIIYVTLLRPTIHRFLYGRNLHK